MLPAARLNLSPWRHIVAAGSGLLLSTPNKPSCSQSRVIPTAPRYQRYRSTQSTSKLLALPNLRPDASHNTLSSFLSYADETNLDTSSKIYLGTHYEYLVLSLLTSTYRFHLTRVAGANDRGIDLLGYWYLPNLPSPIRVIVQCKATAKITPRVIRELEGSFRGAPTFWNDEQSTLALLVGTAEATKGTREAIRNSGVGVIWMCVSADTGRMKQMLWNQWAREMGLEGLDVVVGYGKGSAQESELRLMWNGKMVPKGKAEVRPVRDQEEVEVENNP